MPNKCALHSLHEELRVIAPVLLIALLNATSSFGQSNSPTNSPYAPNQPPPGVVDIVKWQDQQRQNPPSPYTQPTGNQTFNTLNSYQATRNLDSWTKNEIANNTPLGRSFLTEAYLNNGQPNPFYNNGQLTPNWFVPATWKQPYMSWQGVQPNGFVASSSGMVQSGAPGYNPYGGNTSAPYIRNNYNPSLTLRYTQPAPQPNSVKPDNGILSNQASSIRSGATSSPVSASVLSKTPMSSAPNLVKEIENREQTLALRETAGDKLGQVVNRAALAGLFLQQGTPEKALEQIGLAETTSGTIEDPQLQANLLQVKSAAYLASGSFEEAIEVNHKIMLLFRSMNDAHGQAEVYANSGWAFQSTGNMRLAINCYEAALYLFKETDDKDGEVRARLGLASIYQSGGEPKKAREQYLQALPIASTEQRARVYASAAAALQADGQSTMAITHYDMALSLADRANDSALAGAILTGRGRAYMGSNLFELAEKDFTEAQKRMALAGDRIAEAGVIASRGELNYWVAISSTTGDLRRRLKDALSDYNTALALMRSGGDRIGEIGVLTNLGLLYDVQNKYQKAIPFYMQALDKMDALESSARLEEFQLNLANQSASLYERAILIQTQFHHFEEAFALSERARARAFLNQLGNRQLNAGTYVLPEFAERETRLRAENISLRRQIQQELAKPDPEINTERVQTLKSRQMTIHAKYEELLNEMKRADPKYTSFLTISPLTLREAQEALGPDTTVVSYYPTVQKTIAFVLTRNHFQVLTLPVTEGELAQQIDDFRDFSGDEAAPPSLKQLEKWLISPIDSDLKTPTLYIVPFGVLHRLPFGALTSDGKRFLGDEHVISYLPSVSVLRYLQNRVKPMGDQVLVLANSQAPGFPQLPHANEEAIKVASLFNTQPLVDETASTSRLLENAGNFDMLHVIAHFDIDPQNPLASQVILGQEKESDELLDMGHVYSLHLQKTNLVVLSGCESQLGKRSRGDDIFSLSRAFLYAGAPSVIGSLWSVDDQATRELMVAFYSHLRDGQSKAQALRSAQIEIRGKYPSPYYWAGFVLTGDPGSQKASLVSAPYVQPAKH